MSKKKEQNSRRIIVCGESEEPFPQHVQHAEEGKAGGEHHHENPEGEEAKVIARESRVTRQTVCPIRKHSRRASLSKRKKKRRRRVNP